ncbi:glycosyltransferase [soil metagenome]
MIGVVVPAHDEAVHIAAALSAIRVAGEQVDEAVSVVVVCDSCRDATASIAAANGATVLSIEAQNVGRARALGADHLLEIGARWLSFTDADTIVSPGWLRAQLALGSDAVCGSVAVADWSAHGEHADLIRDHFASSYADREGHRHIHGANLGVSAAAYRRAGGFPPLACSEDVALGEALEAIGATIAWSAAPRVTTSARIDARARGGFGDALLAAVAARLSRDSMSDLALANPTVA